MTIRVLSETGAPVEHATVQLVGEQASVQGRTDRDGNVDLDAAGRSAGNNRRHFRQRIASGHWGLWQQQPYIEADAVNTLTLETVATT